MSRGMQGCSFIAVLGAMLHTKALDQYFQQQPVQYTWIIASFFFLL